MPLKVMRTLDKESVNEEKFQQLCDAFAPFRPTATTHRIAVHESGHVIALFHLGITPASMIIGSPSESVVAADTTPLMADQSLEGLINYYAYKLAGQAAEELELGIAMGIEDGVLINLQLAVMQKLTSEERQTVLQSYCPIELPHLRHIQAAHQLYLMTLARSHEILSSYRQAIQELAALSQATKVLSSNQLETFWKSQALGS